VNDGLGGQPADQGQREPVAGQQTTAGRWPDSSQLPMSGRVALVVGASRGIGAVTAEAFAAAGAAVVLAARDTTALKSVAEGIEARGGRALAVGTDVTEAGSMRHLLTRYCPGSAGSMRRSITPARARCLRRSRTSTRTSSTSASPPTSAAPSSGR